ncbi:MAG: class I SAM-dependent methyltransferase [Pseudomonadota bacterium]
MASSFDELVARGVYSKGHVHADAFRALFRTGMADALGTLETNTPRILEVGCGAGAWIDDTLALLNEEGVSGEVFGTDISPKMVETCQARFAGRLPPERFFVGDILADGGYGNGDAAYDLIVAYDVVQQLPRAAQPAAFDAMARHLTPGGVLLIFDNEADSSFGRSMARKKFLTRYFRLPLVPRYFCNARYPAMAATAKRLAADGWSTRLTQVNGLHKVYMLVGSGPA